MSEVRWFNFLKSQAPISGLFELTQLIKPFLVLIFRWLNLVNFSDLIRVIKPFASASFIILFQAEV